LVVKRLSQDMKEKKRKHFWFKLGFLLGAGPEGLVPLYVWDQYEQTKEKKRNLCSQKGEMAMSEHAVWICPICKRFSREPRKHLKKEHDISDGMMDFWIQKGFLDHY